jgi:protein TonB
MKRKNEKVPEFDEIIFENRNRTYGAYDIRKRYKSAASLSLLGGIAISTILIIVLSLTTKPIIASEEPPSVVVLMSDPLMKDYVQPAPVKPRADLTSIPKNLKPVVTDDTSGIKSFMPSTDAIINSVQNPDVNDTTSVIQPTDPIIPDDETPPYVVVKEMPEFPGGLPALLKYVGDNLKYPEVAQNNNIQGKVILKFVVNRDGSVNRIEILKGVDPLLDSEAVRVVSILPKFKPGKQNGVPVPVWFMLPIVFKIENN